MGAAAIIKAFPYISFLDLLDGVRPYCSKSNSSSFVNFVDVELVRVILRHSYWLTQNSHLVGKCGHSARQHFGEVKQNIKQNIDNIVS